MTIRLITELRSRPSSTREANVDLPKENRSSQLSKVGHFINGVSASCVMVSAMQPLFTAKTWVLSGLGLPPLRRLYDGYAVNLISGAPGEGVTFLTHYFSKQFFSSQISDMENVCLSAFSGTVGAIPISICERIMIQQQIHGGSIVATVQRIVIHEGVFRGAFKGLVPTIWRDAPFNCGIFALNEIAQRELETALPNKNMREFVVSLLVGGGVGAATTPFDYAKTKMQADYRNEYTSSLKILVQAMRTEGILSLYKGASVRAALVGGCTYCIAKAKEVAPSVFPSSFYERN